MQRPTVLLVDDDPIITGMLAMMLDLCLDVTVLATNSPLEAQELLKEDLVSLLLTDYLMPQMNGIALIRFLRQRGSAIPALLLTGYCDEPELASNTSHLKPFEVIVKPWNNEFLIDRIKANLSL